MHLLFSCNKIRISPEKQGMSGLYFIHNDASSCMFEDMLLFNSLRFSEHSPRVLFFIFKIRKDDMGIKVIVNSDAQSSLVIYTV